MGAGAVCTTSFNYAVIALVMSLTFPFYACLRARLKLKPSLQREGVPLPISGCLSFSALAEENLAEKRWPRTGEEIIDETMGVRKGRIEKTREKQTLSLFC